MALDTLPACGYLRVVRRPTTLEITGGPYDGQLFTIDDVWTIVGAHQRSDGRLCEHTWNFTPLRGSHSRIKGLAVGEGVARALAECAEVSA